MASTWVFQPSGNVVCLSTHLLYIKLEVSQDEGCVQDEGDAVGAGWQCSWETPWGKCVFEALSGIIL